MLFNYTKSLLLALLLLATAGAAQAQKNFRPGYVVPLSGDTLRGEVDARGGQRMSTLCLFRPAAGAAQVRYAPAELKAYGLTRGDRFESRQMPAPATNALFLQVLAQGKATLYTYVDEDSRSRYFFRKADDSGPVTELVQVIQNVRGDNGLVQERSYPFRQVLSKAFADCFAVQPMLSQAELTDSKLVAIFERYNSCGQAAAPARSMARVTKVHFGLRAGVQQANTTYTDGVEWNLNSGFSPMLGVGLLVMPGTLNHKLAFSLEALHQKQSYTTSYQRNSGFINNNDAYVVDITMQTLRVPLMVRYSPLQGRVQPYLQAGVETSVLLNTHQSLVSVTSQPPGATRPTTSVSEVEMRRLGFGPAVGLGLLVPLGSGSVQVEARYSKLDNASAVPNMIFGPRTTSFLLGYNF
ncbi:PorT family protein [Hymenobacter sp. BT523]|uniref:porin family protein n=1 Tax=Hymenobacter sp. BT523 TaxID=2795725 RepID=UPI0018EA4C72|nr:porin family protein [Hymenobacter sp. BT523]MBJ6110077.1 PorT family protein [Hymenobacter sp. BT523]